jgi:hypothetical protein
MSKKKELVPVSVRAAKALAMQDRETELVELAASTADITAITNPDGYKQVRSARLVLKNLRVDIQNAGKQAREDATAFQKAVIAEEKRLIKLIEPEETRLEALEVAEDERIAAVKQAEIDAEAARQANAAAEIARQQEELRKAQEPPAPAGWGPVEGGPVSEETAPAIAIECGEQVPAGYSAILENKVTGETLVAPITEPAVYTGVSPHLEVISVAPPTRDQLIGAVAYFYLVEPWKAAEWLSQHDWRALAEAA